MANLSGGLFSGTGNGDSEARVRLICGLDMREGREILSRLARIANESCQAAGLGLLVIVSPEQGNAITHIADEVSKSKPGLENGCLHRFGRLAHEVFQANQASGPQATRRMK